MKGCEPYQTPTKILPNSEILGNIQKYGLKICSVFLLCKCLIRFGFCDSVQKCLFKMAERARFELARPLRAYMLSKHADSATLPSLRDFI
jgi:hypothetical protein